MLYQITPIPAPRQVRSDKWKPRPSVLRYRAFKDEVRLKGIHVPEGAKIIFHIKMADSWSKKRKREYVGKPHLQRPDLDNLLKALFDALHSEDSHIWEIHSEKRWALENGIEVIGGRREL